MHCPPGSAALKELKRILRESDLQVLFQTIVSLETGQAIGFDASVRGPSGSPLYAPTLLFGCAERCNLLSDLESLAVRRVLEDARLNALAGMLFHKASLAFLGRCIVSGPSAATTRGAQLVLTMRASQFRRPPDADTLSDCMGKLCAQGQLVALDLLALLLVGDGSLPRGCRPAWVKINRQLVDGIARDPQRQAWLRGSVAALGQDGVPCVAEGIESAVEIQCLKGLGLMHGQGPLIARPVSRPSASASSEARRAMVPCDSQPPQPRRRGQCVGDSLILQRVAPVVPDTPNALVFARFEADAALETVPVVTEGIPVGLIARTGMIDSFARPYRAELYGRKPCRLLMDRDPLIVDRGISLQELSRLISEGAPSRLADGCIVTAEGIYLGTASGQSLLREITSLQLDSARHANPLTQLPGNHFIDDRLWELIEAGASFTVCYADLDHFKPFNDVYGYSLGDELIRLTARVLADICQPEMDFIGHIGGDDFILLFRNADWRTRCEDALAVFDREVRDFFNPTDIERGGYVTENRKGVAEFQPLTCLSIGAVTIGGPAAKVENPRDISRLASRAKKQAKAISGSALAWLDAEADHCR